MGLVNDYSSNLPPMPSGKEIDSVKETKFTSFRNACIKLSESLEKIKNKINGLGYLSNNQLCQIRCAEESAQLQKISVRVLSTKTQNKLNKALEGQDNQDQM